MEGISYYSLFWWRGGGCEHQGFMFRRHIHWEVNSKLTTNKKHNHTTMYVCICMYVYMYTCKYNITNSHHNNERKNILCTDYTIFSDSCNFGNPRKTVLEKKKLLAFGYRCCSYGMVAGGLFVSDPFQHTFFFHIW